MSYLKSDVVNAELTKRNLTKAYVSKKLGYGSDYLSHVISKKKEVRSSFVDGLAKMIGRTAEEITLDEKEVKCKQITMLSAEQLAKCKDKETVNEYAVAVIEAMKNLGGNDE